MKSPFTTPQNNQNFHSKPLSNTTLNHPNTNNNTTTNQHSCYEPTSVLDLRRSPSPVAGGSDSVPGFTALSTVSDESPLHWDDHANLHHHHPSVLLPSSEDWDSMIWDLGLKDDSKNLLQFGPLLEPLNPNPPLFTPQSDPFNPSLILTSDFNSSNQDLDFNSSINLGGIDSNLHEFDCSQLDQLIRAAESVELNELQLAQVILARLNQPLQTPIGKPLQRTAFYFKEALQNFLTGSNWAAHLSASEIVQKIRAYKIFSEISPIPLFANFTANQALLEASDGAMFIHIIDFDIGLGGQWASYMQAIACKAKSRELPAPSLRITAVVPEESSMEASLIKDNLQQFARELGIRFQLEFVLFHSFEVLLFNAIRFINGETIAVNLSPSIFRLLSASDSIAGFLRFLRRISPQIVVFVDNEGCKDSESFSFRRNFINGLEYYSALLESLDAANSGDVNLVRRIERFLLRSRIAGAVAAGRNCILPWRELFSGAGLMSVPLSEFTESQADWLVRRTNIRGFHVAKRQGAMMLCWHERELVATSAWMC
ncbi:Transcription factor GRAS [Macleaya cordata]|uniref:Transcription factor GRAS n=1 Tax=Macleaya cordata TaxID=56857 RepID=A0A200Q258_MACCD|nr:Transcription factor GRAS [Macleaya cordata]